MTLGVPGEISPEPFSRVGISSQGPRQGAGVIPPQEQINLNQNLSKQKIAASNTRSMVKKQSGSSVERLRQKSGVLTPPEDHDERTSYKPNKVPDLSLKALSSNQTPAPGGPNFLEDGGTGASNRRVFINPQNQDTLG